MIFEEIKNIKSTKKELRDFGLILGVVFGLMGTFFFWRGRFDHYYLFVLSFFLLGFGLIYPFVLKPFHKIWMTIALIIGYVMTRVILCLLFYLIITPISLISRTFGAKFLDLNIEKAKNSYWIPRKQKSFSREDYEKQY